MLKLNEWDKATYISVSQNILDHSSRKEIDELKFLRKAHNFSTKRATRVPRTGLDIAGMVLLFIAGEMNI